jgi:two-component system sensor histidine kinase KdpD
MIEAVIHNIIQNSIKYSKEKPVIKIYACLTKSRLNLAISDNGPGVAIESLPKIFDKYERIKHADAKIAGTGLGLAIAKDIMTKHGGEIIANNNIDTGITFSLLFPQYRIKAN